MGGREGCDLNQGRLPGAAEQEETEDEEDVVESFREDVFEALFEVTREVRPGAGFGRVGADAAWGRAGRRFGREAGQVEGEARLTRKHDHEPRVFLAVDSVGENRGDLVAGQGPDFPTRHPGGDLGLPFSAGDHGVVHLHQRLAGLGDEVPGEFRLHAPDRLERELEISSDEGFGLFEELFLLGGRVSQELFLLQGQGHLGALRPVAGVDFENEFIRVVSHGLLHLLGYKDKTAAQAKEMRQEEEACLSLWADLG